MNSSALASVCLHYYVLRITLFVIIVINVYTPPEDKIDDMKDSVFEELERVLEKFP
jgi:hypothetical protein